MKKKDIIVVAICGIIILGSAFFIIKNFMPAPPKKTVKTDNSMNFTGDIDQSQIDKIQQLHDYGTPPMDNIGRDNPFANF